MTCGIYMIQNKVNNKIYIGQAVDIEERWKKHKGALRSNRHNNHKHLQRAWNKYGEDNFEFTIICECDENQLNTMEEYYIFELESYDDRVGYNKTYGGGGCRATKETKKKMSEARKGKTLSEETRKKLSEINKGKIMSEETRKKISKNCGSHRPEVRKKISEAEKGRIFSEEHRKKIGEAHKGKTLSEEHRKKLSESLKGKHHSEETRMKISEAKKGENHHFYGKHFSLEHKKRLSESHKGKLGAECPNSIPIVQLTTKGELVKVYAATQEAGRNGFTPSHINNCCKGKRKTHGGYKWMYLSDYEAMKKED